MGTIIAFLKWRFGKKRDDGAFKDTPPYIPKYAEPDLERIQHPDRSKIQITWVGHATFLIQVAGMNILTDPIWSERASPVHWAGPKREARPGIRFEDLPKIDAVLVSHTHYDHLDRPTIVKLVKLSSATHYFIPTEMSEWFRKCGVKNMTELAWWQSKQISEVKITAVPANHWSRRGLFGTEKAGWGGYMIESSAGVVYFAGDTGYHDSYFKEIGKRFPRIDVGLIPIGAYYPQWFFGRFHIDPREAVMVHKEVGARKSIGMHWGTIKLTEEPLQEPPQELLRQTGGAGMPSEEFSVLKIGETRVITTP